MNINEEKLEVERNTKELLTVFNRIPTGFKPAVFIALLMNNRPFNEVADTLALTNLAFAAINFKYENPKADLEFGKVKKEFEDFNEHTLNILSELSTKKFLESIINFSQIISSHESTTTH